MNLIEALLNVYLHVVFYMCMHVSCKHIMICLKVTNVHIQYPFQYGCCWTTLDFTSACNVHASIYCTVFFTVQNFTVHCTMHCESCISLWSMRIVRQQRDNSMITQPLIEIKRHTPKQTVAVTNMLNKLPACCPQGRGQEDWKLKAGSFNINQLI